MSPSPTGPVHRTHVVPTHVHTPDMLLTIAGVSVSVRQFLLVLVGIALSYRSWLALAWLAVLPGGQGGQIIRVLVALVPLGSSLACAFVQIAGRALDLWGVIVVRYLLRPRRFVWTSVRFQEPTVGDSLSEEEHDGKKIP